MQTLASYTTPAEAHLALSRLTSAGIQAVLRDESTISTDWLYSNAIGGIKIEVIEEDLEAARKILEIPPPETALLTCPRCGSSDTQARPLTLLSALCIFLHLPFPSNRITIDCRHCHHTFTAPRTPPKS